MKVFIAALIAAEVASAFPSIANMPGVDSSLLDHARRNLNPEQSKRATCPFNANHRGAAPYDPKFPYTGAKDGLPGTQVGGVKVPADGDTSHAFEAPGSDDIRGPCPGLNAAANHHFISHDGITDFNELLDALQNLYNVGYDLAVLLATIGVGVDGDIVTGKLSIGCDATSRTGALGGLLGSQPGLNGHNRFEGDASLTRNDFFLANGDDYSFNSTLFGYMQDTCKGNFNRENLSLYRLQRYQQSLADNGNFYFGPKGLVLYGAATFLYELFPSRGNEGTPDLETMKSFFGAAEDGNGGYTFNNQEKIPSNWYNRRAPYTLGDITRETNAMYLANPVLFGGNAGQNNFNTLGTFGAIRDGKLDTTGANTLCLLYQLATENVPGSLSGVVEISRTVLGWTVGKLNPVYKNFGCPLKIT